MDGQSITKKNDLERILLDRSMEAKAKRLSFSLLESITKSFSDEQQIGRGGFAVVYKGLLEHGEVAVKKLTQNCIDDEEKFIEEVRCLMKAKHKNIVRFLGYCSDTQGEMVDNNGQFVMADVRQRLLCFEYVPKGTLDEYIKDASREWSECYEIIKGVCEGLHYLHKKRIVHRDLKPANILLANDMVPKITDFGISRSFGELQTHVVTSKPVGTLGYLAPELLYHNGKITFKSDIYSLGIIIIEILTGDKGYPQVEKVKKDWSHKLEESHKEVQLEQIRVCSKVAQTCLSYNPEDRPSAQEIIDTLEQTEREKRCIEPGASSQNHRSSLVVLGRDCCKSDAATDAATPLGSNVAASNMSKRKGHQLQPPCENEPFSHGRTPDAESMAKKIKKLMEAISKLYTGDESHWSLYLYDMHSYVPTLVYGQKGGELYSAVETTMTSEVQSLCRPLEDAANLADSTLFLQELLIKWHMHIGALQFICLRFNSLDHKYVTPNGRTYIYELGLRLWRDEMVRSDNIRARLIEAVRRQKGGEDELVSGVNKMLMDLGADVNDNMPFLCFRDNTKTLAEKMEMLMQTISKCYSRDMEDIFHEFIELFRSVYDLVIHKKGEELYSAAKTTMASEVQSLCRPLDDDAVPADSALFLQELLTKWDVHFWALEAFQLIFMYMDFVFRKCKLPIKEVGLRLWRNEMARSDKIRPRLIEAVKRLEGGEDELVPGVNKMLSELGHHYMDSMPSWLSFPMVDEEEEDDDDDDEQEEEEEDCM